VKIEIKAKTRSSRSELVGDPDGTYTAFLKSAPVEGAANKELIELLSEEFSVAKSSLEIIKGTHSKNKVVICQK
jgi:uncharacterized protein YggU (UPF0235/DUF167 family)